MGGFSHCASPNSAPEYKAAAAAKSLQSCLTLCDPIDGSPSGSPGPWDSPGKNTGVGCHFLLQCMKMKSESEVAQSCPTLSDPMDCSLPGFSVHGIFQARVLEWGAIGVQNEAGQRLIEFCQENALVIADTLFQQHKKRLYTWTSPDAQY